MGFRLFGRNQLGDNPLAAVPFEFYRLTDIYGLHRDGEKGVCKLARGFTHISMRTYSIFKERREMFATRTII